MKTKIMFVLSLLSGILIAQDFTWMRGSNQSGITGVYGTLGVASPTIDPGGRHGSGTWRDLNGDLWMFGGEGYSTVNSTTWLNDLWKYSVANNEWTWMGGSQMPDQPSVYGTLGQAAATNQPGAREFPVCWTDANGKFWMFGGFGFSANPSQISAERMGDLWKYDPVTNLWTWMGGTNLTLQNGSYGTQGVAAPANRPGCRVGSASWTDASGDLWLFGGRGFPASGVEGFLNDLWKYNITSGLWTWMGGTNQMGQAGVFGTLGVASVNNIPGGKEFPSVWKDALGKVYIFGGRGAGYFNDLWKYDPAVGSWTWLKGSNTANQAGTYGTQGVPATANVPGARFSQAHWTDKYGQFWMFGGQGWSATTLNNLNDLWRYDVCTNNWMWIKGTDTTNRLGIYGTIQIPAGTNMPGSRIYNNYWLDKNQTDLWLIGGEGFDASNFVNDHMNDVWRYNVVAPGDSIGSFAGNTLCSNNSTTLNSIGATSSTQWFNTPVGGSAIGIGVSYSTPPLVAPLGDTTYYFYAQISCSAKPRYQIGIDVKPTPNLIVSTPSLACSSGFTLGAAGAASYLWSNGNSGPVATFSPSSSAITATVVGTGTNGCQASSVITVSNILPSPSFTLLSTNSVVCVNSIIAFSGPAGAGQYLWNNGQSTQSTTYTAASPTTAIISLTFTSNNGCQASNSLSMVYSACTGFAEAEQLPVEFSLLPNPNTGTFKLYSNGGNLIFVRVLSVNGQVVTTSNVDALELNFNLTLAPGIYYIEATDANGQTGRKPFVVTN